MGEWRCYHPSCNARRIAAETVRDEHSSRRRSGASRSRARDRRPAARIEAGRAGRAGPPAHGARVLDAFAGSSALGIEALSRGAAHVLFVERDRAQAEAVEADLRRLHQANATVRCADALQLFSHDAAERFDIVLLDPPFEAGAWQRAVDLL